MVAENQPAEGEDREAVAPDDNTEQSPPTVAVRYGMMGRVGRFTHDEDMTVWLGSKVIVQTKRGIELGETLPLSCRSCNKIVPHERMAEYAAESGDQYYQPDAGRILRSATEDDLVEHEHIQAGTVEKRRVCQTLAEQHGLEMKVVCCEPLFGGERVIVYFTAEGRIDFRALVKELAQEFQTRIEMRQVGARDEARLVADYETCGRHCCCKNFLKNLKPVSMKMAKMQKATLDPSKVSGRCGRLKCCLRYEHESYEELDKNLPQIGEKVNTPHGEGRVVGRQILTQLIQIDTQSGGRIAMGIEELNAEVAEPPPAGQEPPVAESGTEKTEPPSGERDRPNRPRGRGRGKRRGGRQRGSTEGKSDSTSQGNTEPLQGGSDAQGGGTPRKRRRRGRGRGKRPPRGDKPGGDSPSPPDES